MARSPKSFKDGSIGSALMRVCRALDIRAAIEVNKPIEHLVNDRNYLLAIVRKNAGDDGTSIGKMDASDYETAAGPEIAFKLMLQASKDMFESEMWAYVARYAGDGDVLTRYETASLTAARSSVEYWVRYAHPHDGVR